MDMGVPEGVGVVFVSPMHPELTSDKADRCAKCGMKLVPESVLASAGEHGHEYPVGHGDRGHEREDHEQRQPRDSNRRPPA
jgi:hypothetical protein